MLVKQADIEQIEQELHENVCQAISVFKPYFIVFPFILYIDLAISVFKRYFIVFPFILYIDFITISCSSAIYICITQATINVCLLTLQRQKKTV